LQARKRESSTATQDHHHHMKKEGNIAKQKLEKISKDKSVCEHSTYHTLRNKKRKRIEI
jgi:hypothetical protein